VHPAVGLRLGCSSSICKAITSWLSLYQSSQEQWIFNEPPGVSMRLGTYICRSRMGVRWSGRFRGDSAEFSASHIGLAQRIFWASLVTDQWGRPSINTNTPTRAPLHARPSCHYHSIGTVTRRFASSISSTRKHILTHSRWASQGERGPRLRCQISTVSPPPHCQHVLTVTSLQARTSRMAQQPPPAQHHQGRAMRDRVRHPCAQG
jgi:hypothetical protein